MPDWTNNKLELKGEQVDIEDLLNRIKGYDDENNEDRIIDFKNIIAIPSDFDWEFNREISYMALKASGFKGYPIKKECIMDFPDDLRDLSSLTDVEKTFYYKCVRNIDKYGLPDIWCWLTHNWGTTKNSFDSCFDENNNNIIYFNTAWNEVIGLMVALSIMFPNVELLYTFTDYRAGLAAGVIKIKGGKILEENIFAEGSKEAYDVYFDFYPEEKEEYALYNFPDLKQFYFLWQNIFGVKELDEDDKGELIDPDL